MHLKSSCGTRGAAVNDLVLAANQMQEAERSHYPPPTPHPSIVAVALPPQTPPWTLCPLFLLCASYRCSLFLAASQGQINSFFRISCRPRIRPSANPSPGSAPERRD